jgi:hypothetical protein
MTSYPAVLDLVSWPSVSTTTALMASGSLLANTASRPASVASRTRVSPFGTMRSAARGEGFLGVDVHTYSSRKSSWASTSTTSICAFWSLPA